MIGRNGDPRPGRLRPGKWGWLLIVLGVAAALSMTELGHVAAVIALISVIGIPLYFILALLPAAFLVFLFLRLVLGAVGSFRAGALVWALGFGASALFVVDYFVLRAHRENARVDARAKALVAGDIDRPVSVPAGRTIAIARSERFPGRTTPEDVCDDLCQRLLLNGFAKRVLVVTLIPERVKGSVPILPALAPSPAMTGAMYWLEHRPKCPDTKVSDNVRPMRVDAPVPGAGRMATRAASEAMRIKIASGTCLIAAPARLDEADAAFFYGQIARGHAGLAYGFDVSRDTVEAWRVAYFSRDGADWTKEHRATGVRYQRFPGALIPSYIHGQQLQIYNGYVRSERLLGVRKKHEDEPPVAETLTALGVNLRIDDAGQVDAPKVIDEALGSKGPLTSLQASIIDDYLGRLSANRKKRIDSDDVRRLLALAADPRVAFAWPAQGAVTMIAEQQPQLAPQLARLMFVRLDAIVASSSVVSEQAARSAGALSNALAAMPASALKPYFTNIETVANSPGLRAAAQNLIARLYVFGSFAVPAIFRVIDDTLAERAPGRSNWNAGFSAGLRALCQLGSEGAFARPMLEERIRRDPSPFVRQNDRLSIVTLLRMGASESDVNDLLGFDAKNENRMRFALRAASSQRPCA